MKTLRHYQPMRLLVPHQVHQSTGYRCYTVSQMQQLNRILRLKEIGFTLEEARHLFHEGTHRPSATQVREKIRQTEEPVVMLQRRLKTLQRVIVSQTLMDGTGTVYMQSLPSIIVASRRRPRRPPPPPHPTLRQRRMARHTADRMPPHTAHIQLQRRV